ncbi:MAG TPA: aminotransferase class I/II-fold pyridoxal phosphate-dependent enzyme [Thermoanaerobaculia bacterium]|jgi:aspartate/methionine/tyrosine aminotransferase|nr:aminotransferase class I/II-fold pyridoxal phosphate-dependent enzyme [Thermoanaerobaculia bacterium]
MSADPVDPATSVDPVTDANTFLEKAAPAVWAALSPLGRRALQPVHFLPLQTAEARGKPFNATIGQITDGHGAAVPLPSMAAALSGLDEAERSRAFLYSPVEGIPELRRAWRDWQRRGQRPDLPSALPIVTVGTAQARALAAELFVDEGRKVILPHPGREGDEELFALRLGAQPLPCACTHGGHFDPAAVSRHLADLPEGEPAVVLLEFPREETGYIPVTRERLALCSALAAEAERRPLVVIVDDTWAGLGTPSSSLFWGLTGRHPNLIPIKVDGADGQLGFPGGRVGFLTFPYEPESDLARSLESKAKMLLRAQVGSPSTTAQVILLRALQARLPGI